MCIAENVCINDFGFFLIESQSYLKEPLDGFLGLGRSEPFISGQLAGLGFKRGPSFVRALTEAGIIDESTFSLFLSSKEDQDSLIHFGAPQTSSMKTEDNLTYIKLQDDLFWSASCQGFAFNDLYNDYSIPDLQTTFVRDGKIYSIFDSS